MNNDNAWDCYNEIERKMFEACATEMRGLSEDDLLLVCDAASVAGSDVALVCAMLLSMKDIPDGWQIVPLSEIESEPEEPAYISPPDSRDRPSLLTTVQKQIALKR
jgi:hypothetical protein